MKNIAAFFDIDGTIFRNSLLIEHFKLLIKYEFIDEATFSGELKKKFTMWEERRGSYDDYLDEVVNTYVSYLKKINREDISYIANRVIDTKGKKIYSYSMMKIKEHLDKGHLVIFISGSPDFLVNSMAKKLNATDSVGSTYYIGEDNKYTGIVGPMWDSENKKRAIDEFVKKYDIDLSKSYAYGDTTGDFGMFEKVGKPIAINPAKRLFKKIKDDDEVSKKVRIVVERKDMIYILDSNVKYIDKGE